MVTKERCIICVIYIVAAPQRRDSTLTVGDVDDAACVHLSIQPLEIPSKEH